MCEACNIPIEELVMFGQGDRIHITSRNAMDSSNTSRNAMDSSNTNKHHHYIISRQNQSWRIRNNCHSCDICPYFLQVQTLVKDMVKTWTAHLPEILTLMDRITLIITNFFLQRTTSFYDEIEIDGYLLRFQCQDQSSLLCTYRSYIYHIIPLPPWLQNHHGVFNYSVYYLE